MGSASSRCLLWGSAWAGFMQTAAPGLELEWWVGLGGNAYATSFIMFVIDPPYVRNWYLLQFVNSAMSSYFGLRDGGMRAT